MWNWPIPGKAVAYESRGSRRFLGLKEEHYIRADVWVCERSLARGDPAVSHFTQTLLDTVYLCVLYLCNESICLTKQEVRQTDASHPLDCPAASTALAGWLILSTSQWMSVKGQPGSSNSHMLFKKMAHPCVLVLLRLQTLLRWLLFTPCVNAHIYKQFVVLPESSRTAWGEEKQTSRAFWKFSYPPSPMATSPISC